MAAKLMTLLRTGELAGSRCWWRKKNCLRAHPGEKPAAIA
jgi:hypothetical protein